ncbi:MAG: LLM class flavin-dependent oxidoreductase [Ignavibacteriales bacterium]|nr:LLM class flavin-dependent oxidoreductase [Ignavibacteriales bacterium]
MLGGKENHEIRCRTSHPWIERCPRDRESRAGDRIRHAVDSGNPTRSLPALRLDRRTYGAILTSGRPSRFPLRRSPANLAYTAWDLAAQSDGRFILGLGTQVKAHIERRFGMPWPESPVTGKLREQIQVIRALLGLLAERDKAELPRRVLQNHVDVAFFNPGADRTSEYSDLHCGREYGTCQTRRRTVRGIPCASIPQSRVI